MHLSKSEQNRNQNRDSALQDMPDGESVLIKEEIEVNEESAKKRKLCQAVMIKEVKNYG